MKNLEKLIDRTNAAYSGRFTQALLDELMFVGDPVADAAIAALHERSYDRKTPKLEAVRALAKEGVPAARAFVEASAEQPSWLDRRLIAEGQKITLAYVALSQLALTHSLFAGGMFARATLVTRATGRLNADPSSRVRETGAFIGAIMHPGGLEPGALGYETTLRVRLLHSSIRMWMKQMPHFARDYVGEPIDQTMMAMTTGLFSYLNLRSFARLGVSFSDGELAAHHHVWRYVSHLLGIDPRLLTTSLEQERALWSALVAHQTFPDFWGEPFLHESVRTAALLAGDPRGLRTFFRSLFLHLSGPEWFGVSMRETPRLDPRLTALQVGAGAMSVARRWLPGLSDSMAQRGLQRFDKAVRLARVHNYGLRIESKSESDTVEAALEAVAAGVRQRFAPLVAARRALEMHHFDASRADPA